MPSSEHSEAATRLRRLPPSRTYLRVSGLGFFVEGRFSISLGSRRRWGLGFGASKLLRCFLGFVVVAGPSPASNIGRFNTKNIIHEASINSGNAGKLKNIPVHPLYQN